LTILIIERTNKFKREYKKLPDNVKEAFKKQFELFMKHPYAEYYPSLRIKKVKGTNDILEMTILMGVRMTWQFINDGIRLRNIGEHDKVLKTP